MSKLSKLKDLQSRFGQILEPNPIPIKKGKDINDFDNTNKLESKGKDVDSFDNSLIS